jgi:hypothetical protein
MSNASVSHPNASGISNVVGQPSQHSEGRGTV